MKFFKKLFYFILGMLTTSYRDKEHVKWGGHKENY